ncbi:SusC/RagA family TonB-linked outer membrane protein [Algoriphagus chordae]|uniref:TonB-linked SusC/RagA family outer membrane protein n=1 Tax=Algoriphagus chordae TaxID=237019 RepID=A0A2W7R537_9BACT|nr:TonB-dependent receptor [Algoriphagus chordae]PZX50977.1 TonB-linked SusC/RagA family outer membrane protein [Algoriphagus chordae]
MKKISHTKTKPPREQAKLWRFLWLSTFCFALINFEILAQNTQVIGIVNATDYDGALPGATILVKGTNTGTITNIDGKYSIFVPSGAILVFSSIGYITQEIEVGNQTTINVMLEPDVTNMEEVVVIGYGTVKKRDLTGAVTSLKNEDIVQVPAQNPLESIQGKVAGVDITRGSGSSSSGINIRIRGNRSIGASNNPLFIVDGVQTGNIDNINPNDIESMEFLKDASSTAIYGWQGANGIVIISTKKGAVGKPKVTFNSYYGISEVSRYPSVMNGDEYVAIKREANRTTGKWNSVSDDPLIFNTQELDAIANGDWIDYQDLLFRNGTQQNYNIGVNAGSDKTKVYTSVDYFGETGILKFDDVKRYTLRANVDHTFNSWIKAGLQSQIANRDESYRRDPLNMANKIIPLGTVYDENGDFIVYPLGGSSISPLADEQPDIFSNTGKITNVIANVYLDLKPFNGFSFRSNFGTNISNSRVGLFEASNSISRNGGTSRAQYTASNGRFFNWDNVINYQKEIKDHSFTITALSSYVQNEGDDVLAQGENQLLPGQLFYGLGNAPDNIAINSGYAKWNVLSFAARLNYSFKGKYLITLTDRADGASRLSAGNKWAFFPSAAFAWRVVDEGFMQNLESISELKLRASYGVAGNSGIQPYGTQSSLTRMPMAFGESSFQGFTFSPLLGNPDAGWELSATTNFGIDLGLWKNRLSATIDIYNTQTSDLLLPRGLPPTTGVQQVFQNIGKTRNHGIELGINTVNIEKADFTWESTLTFTRNREEIVSLVTDGVDDIGNGWFVGQPISVFYDYEKLGIWQTSEADEAQSYGQVPGDIKVKDQNGDNKIDAVNDRIVLAGNNRPDWFGGLNNKLTYKAFDFSVYFFARWGQTINPNFLSRYDRQSNLSNSSKAIDYWTPENPTNEYPRPNAGVSGSSTLYWSTIGYVDGSYIRLRNISLGYTLPVKDNSFLSNMRIYFTGTNLLTWTKSSKLDEYDPERGGGESFPMLKNYVFGINLGF